MSAPSYADCLPQIKSFASKVFRRVRSAGGSTLQFEDVMQELSIAYVIAARNWKSEHGVPFGAYLTLGMRNHINRWAQKEINEGFHLAIDATTNGENGDGDGRALHDVVADDADLPDQIVEDREYRAKLLEKATPLTRAFLQLLDAPPAELIEGHRALRARMIYGRERGFTSWAPAEISAPLVFRFMGYDKAQITKVRAELARLCDRTRSISGMRDTHDQQLAHA